MKKNHRRIFLTASVLKHVNATTDALTLREIGEKEDLTANESTSSVAIPSTSTWEHKSVEVALNGLEYLAGWVAKKILKIYPGLGDYTPRKDPIDPNTLPSWVSHLSYGGLISPSKVG